ncbi:MAG TPA: TonB family protein [Prolixibacteraceae bacterium]|nr:TonB family protein [Prolixibacteraceae bacterium]HQE52821.1 TonB family protein [Prolixibacteraceae bacterium]HQH76829.1 TonB family protein [Prolixibacteraceae bacterium]HQJ86091.1 TonB family protein [Prolixibacteraceae bacterium]
MRTIGIILAEASLGMALFWLVYHFSLRKVGIFRANRIYLVGALLFSVLFPLFPIHYTVVVENGIVDAAGTDLQIVAAGEGIEHTDGFQYEIFTGLLLWSYLGGVILVLARLAVQTVVLIRVIYQSGISRHGAYKIISNSRYPLPFSFFGYVFYNPSVYGKEELAGILAHEAVHIREKHWADLLLAELFTAVFWFNPFVWLLERSIRQNHEYLADEGVLAQGHPRGRYQALLINQLMDVPVMGFTHPFHYSMNTNRFKMMTLNEKPKKKALRLMWALPVVALLLAAFAEPAFVTKPSSPENLVSPAEGTVSPAQDLKITGKVVKPDGTPLHGASVIIGGSNSGTVTGPDGSFELQLPGMEEITLYISFVGYRTATEKIAGGKPASVTVGMKKELYVLDVNPDKGAVPPPPPHPSGEKAGKATKSKTSDEEIIFVVVESMPEYPGKQWGLEHHVATVRDRLKAEGPLNGRAKVEFTINEEGKPVNVEIKEQSNEAAGQAALTTIREMKPWKPGTQRGKPVPVTYQMELDF